MESGVRVHEAGAPGRPTPRPRPRRPRPRLSPRVLGPCGGVFTRCGPRTQHARHREGGSARAGLKVGVPPPPEPRRRRAAVRSRLPGSPPASPRDPASLAGPEPRPQFSPQRVPRDTPRPHPQELAASSGCQAAGRAPCQIPPASPRDRDSRPRLGKAGSWGSGLAHKPPPAPTSGVGDVSAG